MEKTKVLAVGDFVVETGFCRVMEGIFDYFPRDEFDITVMGINYFGDPTEKSKNYRIYSASNKGNIWGFNRIIELIQFEKPDILFILNDVWVIARYLQIIKEAKLERLPKIVVYYPIDSMYLNAEWFKDFDIVNKSVTYTKFAKNEVDLVAPETETIILPHGVDLDTFYPIQAPIEDIRRMVFGKEAKDEYINGWFVFSGARNQPRKRIDLLIMGFALFSENKPRNVRLFLHCGLKDAGVGIIPLSRRYGIESRLHISNRELGIQKVPKEKLNVYYNITDVGTCVSWGDGWSLPNHEHAATGKCQIVSDHSAFHELYEDCGILIPATFPAPNIEMDTLGFLSSQFDIAEKLEYAYTHQEEVKALGEKARIKFSSPQYQWQNISKQWQEIFKSVL